MTIQEQIEALTQELRPTPLDDFWYIDFDGYICASGGFDLKLNDHVWYNCLFASTNKAEVEEYADCYKRLKLYQLIGEKKKKEFPISFSTDPFQRQFVFGTDFSIGTETGQLKIYFKVCCLGGVFFAREEDRLEALKICGITKEMQEKMSKYGLGGA